jgi:hypothetical protein
MKSKSIHILDFSMTEIEDILSNILSGEKFKKELKKGLKISNIYFAGASLMIDIRGVLDRGSIVDIIVLRHSTESYNLFSGGLEMLLSIKALKTLESIMFLNGIKHQTKWLN